MRQKYPAARGSGLDDMMAADSAAKGVRTTSHFTPSGGASSSERGGASSSSSFAAVLLSIWKLDRDTNQFFLAGNSTANPESIISEYKSLYTRDISVDLLFEPDSVYMIVPIAHQQQQQRGGADGAVHFTLSLQTATEFGAEASAELRKAPSLDPSAGQMCFSRDGAGAGGSPVSSPLQRQGAVRDLRVAADKIYAPFQRRNADGTLDEEENVSKLLS